MRLSVNQTEAQTKHLFLPRSQRGKHLPKLLAQKRIGRLLRRLGAGVVLNEFSVEDVGNELDIIKKEIGSMLQIEVIHDGVVKEFIPEVDFTKDDEGDYRWTFEWGPLLSFNILLQTIDDNVRITFLSSFHLTMGG